LFGVLAMVTSNQEGKGKYSFVLAKASLCSLALKAEKFLSLYFKHV